MLWWIPIAVAGMACLGVLTVVASTAAGRHEGQHILTDPQEEWDAWSAEQQPYGSMALGDEREFYTTIPGSRMEIEGWLPAPPVDPEPWRAQMTAELSPEALEGGPVTELPQPSYPDEPGKAGQILVWRGGGFVWEDPPPEIVLPDAGGWISGPCLDDPGPGDAAVEPPASSGPDQPSRWLAEQLEILRAWSERQQAYAEILA